MEGKSSAYRGLVYGDYVNASEAFNTKPQS